MPQGAATSGYLSNLLMNDFDTTLLTYAQEMGLRYSRYADDISISGKEINIIKVKRLISDELSKLGLKINLGKTKIRRQNSRQEVTGVVVNSKMSAGRLYTRKLRQEYYYIEKFGLYGHSRTIGDTSPMYTLDRLIGQFSHALFLDPRHEDLKAKRKKLLSLRREISGW